MTRCEGRRMREFELPSHHSCLPSQVDVYATGMIMFYLFHGYPPFSDRPPVEVCNQRRQPPQSSLPLLLTPSLPQAAKMASLQHLRPEISNLLPEELANLIKEMWSPVAADRPSAKQVCERLEAIFGDYSDEHFSVETYEKTVSSGGCSCQVV